MVLTLKRWKSRASPGIAAGGYGKTHSHVRAFVAECEGPLRPFLRLNRGGCLYPASLGSGGAGWSSPVARQAHNLKVVGSNPTPATTMAPLRRGFCCPKSQSWEPGWLGTGIPSRAVLVPTSTDESLGDLLRMSAGCLSQRRRRWRLVPEG